MADLVTTHKIIDNEKNAVFLFTAASDGTGEVAVVKVDLSSLNANSQGQACTDLVVEQIDYDGVGMNIILQWDATVNVTFAFLGGAAATGAHTIDFRKFGGIPNNAGAGKTGDIVLTSLNGAAGDGYNLVLYLKKKYD